MTKTAEQEADEDARRARLREWIARNYESDEEFRKAVGMNQGQLSGTLNGAKPFGEKFARGLEIKTRATSFPMPSGYLVNPLRESGNVPELPTAINNLIGDVLFLRTVLNSVLAALARSTPSAAEDIEHALKRVRGHEKNYLADALKTIHDARAQFASQQLGDLDSQVQEGVKKMPKRRRR